MKTLITKEILKDLPNDPFIGVERGFKKHGFSPHNTTKELIEGLLDPWFKDQKSEVFYFDSKQEFYEWLDESNEELFDKAVKLAARHFMSSVPETATAKDIFLALESETLPKNFELWSTLNCDKEEISDLIEILAHDFMNFAKLVYKK